MPAFVEARDQGVLLRVRVQPKASRNAVVGITTEYVRVAVTSPPVDGAANQALIAFLSKALDVRKGQIALKSGDHSRTKTLLIESISVDQVREALNASVSR